MFHKYENEKSKRNSQTWQWINCEKKNIFYSLNYLTGEFLGNIQFVHFVYVVFLWLEKMQHIHTIKAKCYITTVAMKPWSDPTPVFCDLFQCSIRLHPHVPANILRCKFHNFLCHIGQECSESSERMRIVTLQCPATISILQSSESMGSFLLPLLLSPFVLQKWSNWMGTRRESHHKDVTPRGTLSRCVLACRSRMSGCLEECWVWGLTRERWRLLTPLLMFLIAFFFYYSSSTFFTFRSHPYSTAYFCKNVLPPCLFSPIIQTIPHLLLFLSFLFLLFILYSIYRF